MRMRTWGGRGLLIVLLTCSGIASAQDQPKPAELKKMYDDALVQLKGAQERKNQLAAENERLGAQVKDLQQQIAQIQERMEELKRVDADHAEKTFFLRAHYAAWQEFIRKYPKMWAKWKLYLGNDLFTPAPELPAGITLSDESDPHG